MYVKINATFLHYIRDLHTCIRQHAKIFLTIMPDYPINILVLKPFLTTYIHKRWLLRKIFNHIQV